MPYVYVDEVPDGMEEANVYSEEDYNGVTEQLERAQTENTELATENTELATERDNLARELDAAKTKFANAFLSSPQHAKRVQAQEVKEELRPSTFDTLFAGRNKCNAD